MTLSHRFVATAAATTLLLAPLILATPALAGHGGAFVGGMVAGRVLNNMNRQTQAEEYQAYHSQPVLRAAPSSQSSESRIKQLD